MVKLHPPGEPPPRLNNFQSMIETCFGYPKAMIEMAVRSQISPMKVTLDELQPTTL